jgi:hypothetical protein
VFIAHSLLIHANALHSQHAVFFAQPPAVELVVRHDPEKHKTTAHGQEARGEKDDFPGLDGSAGFAAADGDAVGETAAKDLREPVEAEPDGCARALLGRRVPLRGEEGEAGRYSRFEYAEEEADGEGAFEVGYACEARKDKAPDYDVEGRYCLFSLTG